MIDPQQERTALWVLFGVLALAVMGACAAVVLLGLFMAQIARWVFS